uniref:Uncharacterized protein n=1 Tax=viral metagenome TaxID=1070528 RepID=A0A2V0R9F4_9ZZZZ
MPNNRYRMQYGVMIDSELRSAGSALCRLLADHGVKYVSIDEPRTIYDRSWEMSAALGAMHRRPVFATGTVLAYEGRSPTFGKILGLSKKTKSYNGLALVTA